MRPKQPVAARHETADRIRRATNPWHEADFIEGTLAARYLCETRNLTIPSGASGRVLRFHRRCPFGDSGVRRPCLIALYRDIVTDQPRAIHRTALAPNAQKIGRMFWGPTGGAAIKLSADSEVITGLTVGEGIETVLAGMMFGLRPAWALGSAGAIAAFPVLPGVEVLTILVDHDASGTGERAAEECARRWIAAGREVVRIVPRGVDNDIDDVRRIAGVRLSDLWPNA
jgi:hypothetical protein